MDLGKTNLVASIKEEYDSDEDSSMATVKYQCHVCKHYFLNIEDFEKHKLKHTKKKNLYKCMICKFKSNNRESVKKHVRRKHPTVLIKIKCNECEKDFVSHKLLRQHKKEQHNTFCEICGKAFAKRKYLVFHRKQSHSEIFGEQLQCNICSRKFAFVHMLKKHEDRYKGKCFSEAMLPGSNQLMCMKCNKTFVELHALQKHEQMHIDKPYECPLCHVPALCLKRLREHIDRYHVNQEKQNIFFACDVCGKSYTRVTGLNEHMVNVHNGPKLYFCTICNMKFTDLKASNVHRGTHFACKYCNRRYNNGSRFLLKHQENCKMKDSAENETVMAESSSNISDSVEKEISDCPVCFTKVFKSDLPDHLCTHAKKHDNEHEISENRNSSECYEIQKELNYDFQAEFSSDSDKDDSTDDSDSDDRLHESFKFIYSIESSKQSPLAERKKPCIITL